ncbi:ABC transporter permease [bacterium]|nr:ABC transporter permease [bacterium]
MSRRSTTLSAPARWWIRRVVPAAHRQSALIEWEEVYSEIISERGRVAAALWLLGQGLLTLRDVRLHHLKGDWTMLKSIITRMLRPFKRNALYTWINTTGLAIGLCAAMLILLWVGNELSYEKMHVKRDRIHRIIEHFKFSDNHTSIYAMIPDIVAPALSERFPEVIQAVRYRPGGDVKISMGDKSFRDLRTAIADPGFFDMFSFSLLEGEKRTLLSLPNNLVLTRDAAITLFGNTDVIGQTIDIANEGVFQVSGVIQKTAGETHLQFDIMVPYVEGRRMGVPSQQFLFYETFVELHKQVDVASFGKKILNLFEEIAPDAPADVIMKTQVLNDIHLHSNFDIDVEGHGSVEQVQVLALVALLIIVIAGINFVNLSTARAARRAREVGLRKTLGGTRQALMAQFMGEAAGNVVFAGVLALLLSVLLLPWINRLIGSNFSTADLFNVTMMVKIFIILLITSLGAGIYPAIILSSFTPSQALVQGRLAGGQGRGLRWTLVILQFVLSTGLWVLTWITRDQVDFMTARSAGYDRSAVVALTLDETAKNKRDILIQNISLLPGVQSVSCVSELPTNLSRATDYLDWDGKNPNDVHLFSLLFCDAETANTLGIKMAEGRFFSSEREADRDAYVVNETAARLMGMEIPVGQRFSMWEQENRIIGVVKDFHYQSLHQPIKPLIMKYNPERTEALLIRVQGGNVHDELSLIEASWKRDCLASPFEPIFLENEFQHLHIRDRRFGTLFSTFSTLALGVSCLGLLGLAVFMVEQRTREMGIRRVLGASGGRLMVIMTREFIIGILIANILAAPLAFWAGSRWLERFAYRIDIGASPFVLAFIISMGLTLVVATGQAMKLLRMNPVKTLRHE